MKIKISTSAASVLPALSKGMRVAVKHGRDEWYTGTVTKTFRSGKVTVTFDDGGTDSFESPTNRTFKIISSKRKNKLHLTDSEVTALGVKAAATTNSTTRKKPLVIVPPVKSIGKSPRELSAELLGYQEEFKIASFEYNARVAKRLRLGISPEKRAWRKPYVEKFADLNKKITKVLEDMKRATPMTKMSPKTLRLAQGK